MRVRRDPKGPYYRLTNLHKILPDEWVEEFKERNKADMAEHEQYRTERKAAQQFDK